MSACACMGPIGNCPCVRRQRGEVLPPDDVFISGKALATLTYEELRQFEDLKMKALSRSIFSKDPK